MVVLGDLCCNWLDLSCMGVGYGPPTTNTTNTGDLWTLFGAVPSTCFVRYLGPESVPKKNWVPRYLAAELRQRSIFDINMASIKWQGPSHRHNNN